eukprot:scaffold126845_cov18-Tisochrysis_lutea.AAC.1
MVCRVTTFALKGPACCRSAAFSCCPGLVKAWGYLMQAVALVFCGVPCLLCKTWYELEEEDGEEVGVNQGSIKTAGGESRTHRNTTRKE